MTEGLQRLVIGFSPDGIQVRALYRTHQVHNPGTVARRREVSGLVRTGLEQALEALEASAGVEVVGTSGFTTREDVLSLPHSDEARRAA